MKIFSDTKIYVTCPGNSHTGGPELLHQLCSLLLQYGLNAQMFYTSGNRDNPVNDVYEKYHLPYVWKVEDAPHNVLIFYEVVGDMYYKYNRVQKIFWWLSVDNYLVSISNTFAQFSQRALTKSLPKFFYFQETEKDTEHWVQSEYARQFVLLNGVHEKNIYVVEDYISQAFLSQAANVNLEQKEDIVVFNPKKGLNVTRKLMELAPEIDWVPIEKMTPEQVQQTLSKAKVYIDFGNHPGKDRIPREAAISGCVVITGKRGAARNDVDINIPAEFKFGETDEELYEILIKICAVFKNFMKEYDAQKAYREKILDDKRRFESQVVDACGLKSRRKINAVAFWQGYSSETLNLLENWAETNLPFVPKFTVDDDLSNGKNLELEFVTRRSNRNFLDVSSDGNGGLQLPFISADDAKFLYAEGRIKKFIMMNPEKTEIESLVKRINPEVEDVILMYSDVEKYSSTIPKMR